jgi:hypothetical protein
MGGTATAVDLAPFDLDRFARPRDLHKRNAA